VGLVSHLVLAAIAKHDLGRHTLLAVHAQRRVDEDVLALGFGWCGEDCVLAGSELRLLRRLTFGPARGSEKSVSMALAAGVELERLLLRPPKLKQVTCWRLWRSTVSGDAGKALRRGGAGGKQPFCGSEPCTYARAKRSRRRAPGCAEQPQPFPWRRVHVRAPAPPTPGLALLLPTQPEPNARAGMRRGGTWTQWIQTTAEREGPSANQRPTSPGTLMIPMSPQRKRGTGRYGTGGVVVLLGGRIFSACGSFFPTRQCVRKSPKAKTHRQENWHPR